MAHAVAVPPQQFKDKLLVTFDIGAEVLGHFSAVLRARACHVIRTRGM